MVRVVVVGGEDEVVVERSEVAEDVVVVVRGRSCWCQVLTGGCSSGARKYPCKLQCSHDLWRSREQVYLAYVDLTIDASA